MIQQKIPNAAGPGKDVWVEPGRDVGHVFPLYVEWATRLAIQHNSSKKDEILQYAERVKKFIEYTKDPEVKTLKDAVIPSGIHKHDTEGARILVAQILNIVTGAFFEGARASFNSSTGGGFYTFDDLKSYLKSMEDEQRMTVFQKLARLVKKTK